MFVNARNGISCKDIALREGAYAIIDLLARAEAAEAALAEIKVAREKTRPSYEVDSILAKFYGVNEG